MLLWRSSAYRLVYEQCTCLIYRAPDLKTVLIYNDVSTEVNAENKEQEDGKRIIRNKETKQTQQNAMRQKLRSYKSHQSENTNICSEKAKNS
jgi:hypothetical protein